MEAEQPDQMPVMQGDSQSPTGPKALGMIAGIPQAGEDTQPMQAAPTTPPQSSMATDTTAQQGVAQSGAAVTPGTFG
ncbi:MAG TPA: hypothetical protein DCG04_16190, partial [Rhodospirillaceae bacterium]|nr:hypothetical protein [Rhodospirillaceae bacterium]